MSDSDSYEPDSGSEWESESESDLDDGALVIRSIERKTRSASRAVSASVKDEEDDFSTFDFAEYADDDMNPVARRDRVRSLQARLQAIPREALNAYNGLLVEMEKDVELKNMNEHPELLTVEQRHAVVWTATEKELFFNMLDRKGKNGIKEIAAAIPDKSELEVMHYIDCLHEGLVKQHVDNNQNATLLMGDYPGATEVSKECEEKLEEFAEIMSLKQEAESSWASRDRYHKFGIVTEATAKGLVKDDEVCPPLHGGIDKAINILNVPNWLQLSRKLFMNLGGKRVDDNWIYHKSYSAESPSMTGDALMDFYALTMSITRRLIQSSLFFSMARISAMKQMGEEIDEEIETVRTRDVRAAIETLNMKYDRGNTLVDFARRNGVLIQDIRNRKGWKPQVLDYDYVEELLALDDDEYDEYDGSGSGHSESEVEHGDNDYDGENEEEDEAEDPVEQTQAQAQVEEPVQELHNDASELDPQPQPQPQPQSQLEATMETSEEEEVQPKAVLSLVPSIETSALHSQPQSQSFQEAMPPFSQQTRRRRYSEGSYQSSQGEGEAAEAAAAAAAVAAAAEDQSSDAEEDHAAQMDLEYDRRSEFTLYQTLQLPIPPLLTKPVVAEEDLGEHSKKRPLVRRKRREDMVPWRDRTIYRAEWEEYGDSGSELENELQENRRKRRKIEAEDALSGGKDVDSEDYGAFSDSIDGVGAGEGDAMDIDPPQPRPTIAVELPKYGTPAWAAFLEKVTAQSEARAQAKAQDEAESQPQPPQTETQN
jgi:RNA polymerase I-specific transcription initiation factor RRN5